MKKSILSVFFLIPFARHGSAQPAPPTSYGNLNAPVLVNVMNFGAIGNGVHDDTAAIQAAINAAEFQAPGYPSGQSNSFGVFLPAPPDVYAISLPLVISNTYGFHFIGSSTHGTVIQWAGPTDGTAMYVINSDGAVFKDFTLYTPGPSTGRQNGVQTLAAGIQVYNTNATGTYTNMVAGQKVTWDHVNVTSPSGNVSNGWYFSAGSSINNDYSLFISCEVGNFTGDAWQITNQNSYNMRWLNCEAFGWDDGTNIYGNHVLDIIQGNGEWDGGYGYGCSNVFYIGNANPGPFVCNMGDFEGSVRLLTTGQGSVAHREITIQNTRFQSITLEGTDVFAADHMLVSNNIQGAFNFIDNYICPGSPSGDLVQIALPAYSPFDHSEVIKGNFFQGQQATNFALMFPVSLPTEFSGNTAWYMPTSGQTNSIIFPELQTYTSGKLISGGATNAGSITVIQMAAPYAAAVANAGSSTGTATWIYSITATDGQGETTAANTAQVALSTTTLGPGVGTNLITVATAGFIPGAWYRWYRIAPCPGTNQAGFMGWINYSQFPNINPTVMDYGQAPLVVGATPPTINTTGRIYGDGAGLTDIPGGSITGSLTNSINTPGGVTSASVTTTNVTLNLGGSGSAQCVSNNIDLPNATNLFCHVRSGPVFVASTSGTLVFTNSWLYTPSGGTNEVVDLTLTGELVYSTAIGGVLYNGGFISPQLVQFTNSSGGQGFLSWLSAANAAGSAQFITRLGFFAGSTGYSIYMTNTSGAASRVSIQGELSNF